jgi:phage terminase large subunit GpA-like protein
LPKLFERAATSLAVPKATTPDAWAIENRIYPETTGKPGPRDPFYTPYMVPLGRAAVSGRWKRVVGVTSAQSGKTDTLLDIIGERLDTRPVPILYVGPSKEFNTDQFEPRLMGLFDEAKSLRGKVMRGKRNKKTLKYVAGVRIRLAHAGSSTALKSDPAALALVDEYDEMLANIKGQGDPLGLVEARGKTYADFVTVIVSTPSRGVVETEIDPVNGLEMWKPGKAEEIESPIWRLWQEGTRHHFAWQCPHCSEYFVPMKKLLRWPKGSTPAQARRGAFVACPAGCVIEEEHKDWMNANGLMIAPGQTIEDAKADRNLPDTNTYSQWSSGLCSPFMIWGEIAENMLTANISGEQDKIQTKTNADYGELYSQGADGELPSWQELLKHRVPLRRGQTTRQAIRLVCGVDVGKRGLYYVIRAFGARGTSWLVDHGFLHGYTDEDGVWGDLATIMLAPVGGMQIERVFIDSGFRPDKPEAGSEHRVYEFCRRYSFLCSPTKGRDTLGGRPYYVNKIEVKPDGSKRPYSIDLVHLNSDFFKSLVHSRVKTPIDQLGAFFLHEEADEEYARQVLSEVRVVEAGTPKAKWIKQRRDNHFLDCEAMAAAAAYSLNVHAIPEGTVRQWGDEDEIKIAPKQAPARDDDGGSQQPPPPELNLRDRFRNFGGRMR